MTRSLIRTSALVIAALIAFAFGAPSAHAALDCAFQDVNDNGVLDGGDVIVTDAQWIGKEFQSNHPFVVPAGCNVFLTSAPGPLLGIRVIAPKITIIGSVQIMTSGGRGIVLVADKSKLTIPGPVGLGDESITIGPGVPSVTKVFAGGVDLYFSSKFPNTPAVVGRSIAIFAVGKCSFSSADIEGTVPTGSTEIGIGCGGDVTFRGSTVRGSRTNIQSITGEIDARSFAPVAAGTLGDACDDPVKNLQGGAAAPGNGNGVLDAVGDFPCVVDMTAFGTKTFATLDALQAFCGASGRGGPNTFHAVNDPLIMIAQKDLDLRGAPSSPPPFLNAGDTILQGHSRITLGSAQGNILASNTQINTTIPGFTPANGAAIEFGAGVTVNRLPDDREDLIGPATGTLDIADACIQAVPKIKFVLGMTVTGTPDPPPCDQFPADFLGVASINH